VVFQSYKITIHYVSHYPLSIFTGLNLDINNIRNNGHIDIFNIIFNIILIWHLVHKAPALLRPDAQTHYTVLYSLWV